MSQFTNQDITKTETAINDAFAVLNDRIDGLNLPGSITANFRLSTDGRFQDILLFIVRHMRATAETLLAEGGFHLGLVKANELSDPPLTIDLAKMGRHINMYIRSKKAGILEEIEKLETRSERFGGEDLRTKVALAKRYVEDAVASISAFTKEIVERRIEEKDAVKIYEPSML